MDDKILVRIKTPVEYSFRLWIDNHPESLHWADEERFYTFVRDVCRFGKKWKSPEFLKEKILEIKPDCSRDWLEERLIIFSHLLHFSKIKATKLMQFQSAPKAQTKGFYIERGYKNGKFYEKEIKRAKIGEQILGKPE